MHIVEPKRKAKATRSIKYKKVIESVERNLPYNLKEAVTAVKTCSTSNFDGTIEIHIRISKKKGKGSTESSKATVSLPSGLVKAKKVIVLDEDKIEEIAKTKKIDFDVAIASPSLMPKIGKIAKILGPVGKMPDPKSGTVTDKPEAIIAEINSGRLDYKIDPSNIIHLPIGKISWDDEKILANAQAVIATQLKGRIMSVALAPTHGPSIRVDLSSI